MKCHVCGGVFESAEADFPFRVSDHSILIIKGLPGWQCNNCGEFMIDDPVMAKVEGILKRSDGATELEVVRFAA